MQLAQVLKFGEEAVNQGLAGAPSSFDVAEPSAGFGPMLSSILSGVMIVSALLVLIYLVWGGIEWLTSGGEKAKLEKARNRITQAIIGIIVLAATTAIFMMVQSFLNVEILNFTNRPTKTPIRDKKPSSVPGPGGAATGDKK